LKSDKSIFPAILNNFQAGCHSKFKGKYNLDNCGFSAKISEELPGKYRVGIHVFRKVKG
jgi:hypothetical protein